MRISAIQNYQRNTAYFSGEKKNKLKNAAGAAAIALATAVPATNADAQYYYYTPPITFQPPATLHTPASVPDCFIIGDLKTFNGGKSMEQVFNEIDLRCLITYKARRTSAIIERIIKSSLESCRMLNAAPVFFM